MKLLRALALSAFACFAVVGVLKAADMTFSMGTKFQPLGPALFSGEDMNVMVDRVNDISDGTYALDALDVTGNAEVGGTLAVT